MHLEKLVFPGLGLLIYKSYYNIIQLYTNYNDWHNSTNARITYT